MESTKVKRKISIAHSPDADDAFMFYALTENIISKGGLEIEHILQDIQALNKEAEVLKYDVQAVSFFAYPNIVDKYQLLSCGGSVGYGYGPLLVSKKKFVFGDLKGMTIAVPGENTTAFLLLKLLIKDFSPVVVPFDQILESVLNDKYPLGLVIHEGQLSYLKYGLNKVLDLGGLWLGKTNLPLPLGGNVIRISFSEEEKKEINSLIKTSIAYALQNKGKIIPCVSKYAKELNNDHKLIDKFVSMYVNEFTLDYGIAGKLAIRKLYQMAFEDKLIDKMPTLDFVV